MESLAEPPRVTGIKQRLLAFLEGPHSKRGLLVRYWRLRDKGFSRTNPQVDLLFKAYRKELGDYTP